MRLLPHHLSRAGTFEPDPSPAEQLIRRIGGTKASPTADLYLGWSCANLLKQGKIRQLTPTVFQSGPTLIVLRHDRGLDRLPAHDRLILLMDDDWRAGIADPGVPASYRAKLALIEAPAARRLEARADVIVTASAELAARYRTAFPGKPVLRLDPAWPVARAPLPPVHGMAHRIAWLGALSHRGDMKLIVRAIEALRSSGLAFHLTLSGNHPYPRAWRIDPQIEIVPALPWPVYRAWMLQQRFDIGLYPLLDTAFNRARSLNKLAEYDQFGAAVLAPAGWINGHLAGGGLNRCYLVEGGERAWLGAITEMLSHSGLAHRIALQNRTALTQARGLIRQRLFWKRLLGIGHRDDR